MTGSEPYRLTIDGVEVEVLFTDEFNIGRLC